MLAARLADLAAWGGVAAWMGEHYGSAGLAAGGVAFAVRCALYQLAYRGGRQ